MAKAKGDELKIPAEMREFTQKSVDQAQQAFDAFMAATQKALAESEDAVGEATSGAHDMGRQVLAATEENLSAAFAHARRLAEASGMDEVLKLQSEFLKTQMASLGEQARVLADKATKGPGGAK